MSTDISKELYCKDCKYSSRSIIDIIFANKIYKCTHPSSFIEPRINLVYGYQSKGYYQSCSEMRYQSDGICGKYGKFWSPKNTKKFLFTILKKEN